MVLKLITDRNVFIKIIITWECFKWKGKFHRLVTDSFTKFSIFYVWQLLLFKVKSKDCLVRDRKSSSYSDSSYSLAVKRLVMFKKYNISENRLQNNRIVSLVVIARVGQPINWSVAKSWQRQSRWKTSG
jgi:hypothetical protein